MASCCSIDMTDTNSAKKRKFIADQDSCKSQKGINAVDMRARKKYTVCVAIDLADEHSSSNEEQKSLFSSLMKEAGCLESQITSHGAYCFFANLTEEEAKKLSGVNHINAVRPSIKYGTPRSLEVHRFLHCNVRSSWQMY